MACKQHIMAHRKRPGTNQGGSSMAEPLPRPCPAPFPSESHDRKLPVRSHPASYPKDSHDQAHVQPDEGAEPHYCGQLDAELTAHRPATPSTPDHQCEQSHDHDHAHDHAHSDFRGRADSLDGDSSSDYVNNTSDEEEDYDEGLAEEDEGVTYYIRYCPEDDSYMESVDCSRGDCSRGDCSRGDCRAAVEPVADTDECQEAVEEWEEGEGEEREVGEVVEHWVQEGRGGDDELREEWVEEEGEGEEEEVREEWVEGEGEEEEVREEWVEGEGEEEEVREEWVEGEGEEEEVREEWVEGEGEEEEVREEWVEGGGEEEEVREEWVEGEGEEEEEAEVREQWVDREGEEEEEGEVRCEVVEQDADQQIYDGRPEPVLDHHHPSPAPMQQTPPREEEEEEESEEYLPNEEEEEGEGRGYTEDYYVPEANGNCVGVSPYRGRQVGEGGEMGEEAEEDIDLIVAEIKMSMSMGSLSSGTDHSPEELAHDSAPANYPPPALPPAKPSPAPGPYPPPHRHDSRPKSLNLPSTRHNNPDLQRGFKVRASTPEDRPHRAQEQVTNGPEQQPTRKQNRSDLNLPLENNNTPEQTKKAAAFPSFVDVPGPCEPEDLIDGIIFAANYLGSTQLLSERNPSKNIRMMQAQEAVSRVKSPEGDGQSLTEVDLFISTQRIKVLNADSQETMMDNALRTISYIADIGNIVVLMARRRMPRTASQDCIETTPGAPDTKKQYKMICHVFESEDAQLIAQSIGQAFSVAYQEFLRANGINPEDLSQKEYSDIINTQEMYNDDLIHFSNSENCKELLVEKQKGEMLGVVIVESGWGSILPTVILANMLNGAPAARSGKLSIGDQIMSINNTSLVGLPLATCQGIIKGLKNQVQVKLNIVSCPPVTTVLIKRPDLKYQLGFSVQNGIICSLMRGGIAERGGVRVGHRIIEINSQSVVATAHEKIVQALSNSVGEIHMKTMPAAMFRLLTGQETPMYI
ncbi:amyloid-beta A4 precursor protein-binding family A member 2 isoform X2 [Osmerus eperlanus]|uniref:amyloid-beta A4 precursor protein-binding family A member 2 isoform X2 n=1 Tax=Osmerus eperlanus TaxID=29151 RepID=UPI002E14D944